MVGSAFYFFEKSVFLGHPNAHSSGILSVEISIHELISHYVASPPKLARYGGWGSLGTSKGSGQIK